MTFISYAQNFEDVMLWRALKHVKNGFYIDIGAQDPVIHSVSLAFYERGWRGVHVEPTEQYARRLQEARPGEFVEQVAIGNASSTLSFFKIADTGLSTADSSIAERHKKAGFRAAKMEVPMIPLDALLDKYGDRQVHWLKIDVEGFEKTVLEGWKASPVRPWIVVIEATEPTTQEENHHDWEPIILSKGYRPAYFDGLNRFYVHGDHESLIRSFNSPPNVFDKFVLSGFASQPFFKLAQERAERAEMKAQLAEARAQRAAGELASLRVQNNWRLTEMVRGVGDTARRAREFSPRSWLQESAARMLRALARRGIAFVDAHPRLRSLGIMLVHRSGLYHRMGPLYFKLRSQGSISSATIAFAQAASRVHSPEKANQLLVDISELAMGDARSGIQRVVRSVLRELLDHPPEGFRVEPVYATAHQSGYRYARNFAQRFQNFPGADESEESVSVSKGDIFLGLDLQRHVVLRQVPFYESLKSRGAKAYFVVYDLLPISLPKMFAHILPQLHATWLDTVAKADGLICISRAVADELEAWLSATGDGREAPINIGWFHLGADIENSLPTSGIPEPALRVLEALEGGPTFLMVGTVEPRKGYEQTLEAFERLWAEGLDVRLAVVGRQGWMVDRIVKELRTHPQNGRRLFWIESASDEFLERIYSAATALILASEGEGFGLPLVEAARHKLPILAREIPVFHEVAGKHAYYFAGNSSADLAAAIQEWLRLWKAGQHPTSGGMPWLTWSESVAQLKQILLEERWHARWVPPVKPKSAAM